jgi:hypothetical protein
MERQSGCGLMIPEPPDSLPADRLWKAGSRERRLGRRSPNKVKNIWNGS